jgi:hypothetical protein
VGSLLVEHSYQALKGNEIAQTSAHHFGDCVGHTHGGAIHGDFGAGSP